MVDGIKVKIGWIETQLSRNVCSRGEFHAQFQTDVLFLYSYLNIYIS
jgi:hypothetical protein